MVRLTEDSHDLGQRRPQDALTVGALGAWYGGRSQSQLVGVGQRSDRNQRLKVRVVVRFPRQCPIPIACRQFLFTVLSIVE